jgi:hypothetical protein
MTNTYHAPYSSQFHIDVSTEGDLRADRINSAISCILDSVGQVRTLDDVETLIAALITSLATVMVHCAESEAIGITALDVVFRETQRIFRETWRENRIFDPSMLRTTKASWRR